MSDGKFTLDLLVDSTVAAVMLSMYQDNATIMSTVLRTQLDIINKASMPDSEKLELLRQYIKAIPSIYARLDELDE